MTGDPERLLSAGSGADPLERELLGSVRHVGPPDGAKDRAWRSLAGQMAVAAAVGAATSTTAAAASKASMGGFASWALSTKVALVALAGGLALGSGYLVLRDAPEASPSSAPRSVVAPVVTHAAPVAPPTPKVQEVAPRDEAPPEEAPPPRHEPRRLDQLKAESALLTEARAELRAGNAAGAQATLERMQSQFPRGVLTQERQVLGVEVLAARGDADGARRAAEAFVKRYPHSPHNARLERFLR